MDTKLLLYCLLCYQVQQTLAKDYTGYRLVNIYVPSHEFGRELLSLGDSLMLNFLNMPVAGRTVEIIVPPESLQKLVDMIETQGVANYDIDPQDVETIITRERMSMQSKYEGFRSYRPFKDLGDIFAKFPRYLEIVRWLKQVTRDYPQYTSLEDIGKTYSGKPTLMLKVSSGGSENKKVIWIDGAIHGREWISATTVLYLLREILRLLDSGDTALLQGYDWYFLPVANPDGYEFSHSTDRLWRKNRRPTAPGCYGIDLNRNFGHHWGVTKQSVSSQGCSDQYGGKGPFSEPETANIRDKLASFSGKMAVYLSFHSYSQLWLVPWGYSTKKPQDFQRMMCVAEKAAAAARSVNGLDYRVGTLDQFLYTAAGGSFDWAKYATHAEYSYTVELRPSAEVVGPVFDRGFIVSTSEIIPAGQEMWTALLRLMSAINEGECLNF